MKKFELDLSEWKVSVPVPRPTEDNPHAMGEQEQVYPFRENLNLWLRAAGVFRSGEDIAEAVVLAGRLRDADGDSAVLDEREADILKKALNRHIEATADGKTPAMLGGPLHEQAICRVFGMKEVE